MWKNLHAEQRNRCLAAPHSCHVDLQYSRTRYFTLSISSDAIAWSRPSPRTTLLRAALASLAQTTDTLVHGRGVAAARQTSTSAHAARPCMLAAALRSLSIIYYVSTVWCLHRRSQATQSSCSRRCSTYGCGTKSSTAQWAVWWRHVRGLPDLRSLPSSSTTACEAASAVGTAAVGRPCPMLRGGL